jgi:hypothetical protein
MHSNIRLSWFSLFMADNLFSSKQRPFVLFFPDHRDHWKAEGVGWHTGSRGLSVAQARKWQKARPWAKERAPGVGVRRRQNRLGITTLGGYCGHTGFGSEKLA